MRAKLALIALLGVLGGCAHLTNNDQALCAHQPLCGYHADYGYRFMPEKRSQKDDKYADETLVVVTMSGGGMKAAALAYGTLLALKAMPARNGDPNRSFLSDVDLISSVSGGSVTADRRLT